jgi:hypothetical protein
MVALLPLGKQGELFHSVSQCAGSDADFWTETLKPSQITMFLVPGGLILAQSHPGWVHKGLVKRLLDKL